MRRALACHALRGTTGGAATLKGAAGEGTPHLDHLLAERGELRVDRGLVVGAQGEEHEAMSSCQPPVE